MANGKGSVAQAEEPEAFSIALSLRELCLQPEAEAPLTPHEPFLPTRVRSMTSSLFLAIEVTRESPRAKLPSREFSKVSCKDSLAESPAQSSSLAFQDDQAPL